MQYGYEVNCVFHESGVTCSSLDCGKCGWNPAVEAKRKQKIREQGRKALSGKKELDDLYAVRYILKNGKEYGGDMTHNEMRHNLGIGYETYMEEKRVAVSAVKKLLSGVI